MKEEESLFKADAVNEEDPERDRATQEEESVCKANTVDEEEEQEDEEKRREARQMSLWWSVSIKISLSADIVERQRSTGISASACL